ncbi:hypothetical protein BD410DRAFT_766095 [Rickenella mellea]|uniref:Cytochrome c oxidase assembly protein COX16, mitochondrial n=1 Tax=Rickenella mellea TaxID=50990 RepID=A0A4Y7QBD1_9AGAM|nr:hypothetical protein BD410DRAFT_766095 [Rickenella mellea]
MPVLPRTPLSPPKYNAWLRKHPLLFGASFVGIIVAASFGLQTLSQTRYDLHDQKVTQMSKQEMLTMHKRRRNFDIREEYYRLEAQGDKDWEPIRVKRPPGVPDWGVPPPEPPSPPPTQK